MAEKSIPVAMRIEQIRDGSRYRGFLKLGGVTFNYELTFTVPIPQLDDEAGGGGGIHELHRLFKITLKNSNTCSEIWLTDQEFVFFFGLLVPFAIKFYNNPQTRAKNMGSEGRISRGSKLASITGHSISIRYDSSGVCTVPPEDLEMLRQPRFGCLL